jgi:hypothetical protein
MKLWLLSTDLRQPLKRLSKISRLPEFHLPISGNL